MRRLALVFLLAAGLLFALLPPRSVPVAPRPGVGSLRGALHIHTRRSDGTGSVDDVARAAAAAGLSFVVLTDHGNGTRVPEPPVYRDGVLCIDAVEISTDDGHVVALGLPETPYPLGGEARDVVEDIHRLRGWALAAHPGSPKADLAWQDWQVPVDGIEWINGDSEWRDERLPSLLRVLLTYPFRPRESLATLLDRPVTVLERWDDLLSRRTVVGLAASDAHARVGLTSLGEPYDSRASLPLPSYVSVFSALSIAIEGVALSKDAAIDAAAILSAIREGHLHSTIDGLASGGGLTFTATSGDGSVTSGERLPIDGPVTIRAQVAGPSPRTRITLFRNGSPVRSVDGLALEETAPPAPAVYRVEVGLAGGPGTPAVPWIVSNPIYVGPPLPTPQVAAVSAESGLPFTSEQLGAARVERSDASEGAVGVTRLRPETEILFRYALGGRVSDHPYSATVLEVPDGLSGVTRVRFNARADRPMRMSLQVRSPGVPGGNRWGRSFYLDETARSVIVPLDEMRPLTGASLETQRSRVDSLMFVVDDLHTPLGNGGRIWIAGVALQK